MKPPNTHTHTYIPFFSLQLVIMSFINSLFFCNENRHTCA